MNKDYEYLYKKYKNKYTLLKNQLGSSAMRSGEGTMEEIRMPLCYKQFHNRELFSQKGNTCWLDGALAVLLKNDLVQFLTSEMHHNIVDHEHNPRDSPLYGICHRYIGSTGWVSETVKHILGNNNEHIKYIIPSKIRSDNRGLFNHHNSKSYFETLVTTNGGKVLMNSLTETGKTDLVIFSSLTENTTASFREIIPPSEIVINGETFRLSAFINDVFNPGNRGSHIHSYIHCFESNKYYHFDNETPNLFNEFDIAQSRATFFALRESVVFYIKSTSIPPLQVVN